MPSAIVAAGFLDPNGMARALEAIESRDVSSRSSSELARDEDFWFEIRQAFQVDRTIVNSIRMAHWCSVRNVAFRDIEALHPIRHWYTTAAKHFSNPLMQDRRH